MRFSKGEGIAYKSKGFYAGEYDRPSECIYCSTAIYPTIEGCENLPYGENGKILFVSFKCPACEKIFIAVYEFTPNELRFMSAIPAYQQIKEYPELYELSDGFQKYHLQSMRAFRNGDEELGIIGFRTALEFLIKDYAIKCDGADKSKTAEMHLDAAIKAYGGELANCEGFIRVIGNDYTHYLNKHSDIPHETMLKYYEITVDQILLKYRIKHTPIM